MGLSLQYEDLRIIQKNLPQGILYRDAQEVLGV